MDEYEKRREGKSTITKNGGGLSKRKRSTRCRKEVSRDRKDRKKDDDVRKELDEKVRIMSDI